MKFPSPPEKYSAGYLQQLDGRTGVAQVMRARYDALTSDLGGASRLSYQQRSLIERALWLEYWLGQQEQTLANGGDFDVGKWVQACNGLQGIFAKLGLDRVAHDVPDLAAYLAKAKSTANAKEGEQ